MVMPPMPPQYNDPLTESINASGLSHARHRVVITHHMDMTTAGVIHLGNHHLRRGLNRLTTAHLQTIGAPAGAGGVKSSWRLTKLTASREKPRLLEVVFHHLVVMELEIGRHQIGALHAHQQQALAAGLSVIRRPSLVSSTLSRCGAQIEEIEFLGLRVKFSTRS